MNAPTNPWHNPNSYDATADESECVEDMLGVVRYYENLAWKARWAMPSARAGRATPRAAARLVHSATIAIAVFCAVYFGLQMLRWAL